MPDELSEIRQFVAVHTGGADIADDQDIFAAGYVNSLFVVQAVMWLERTFDLSIQGADLHLDNIRSIKRMGAFVAARRHDASPGVAAPAGPR
ncbi:phosphopantetheine-binding protein [Streptomyces sioyaensis]|uniref:phosphopantetheine-binding protein n=1 Tax=Streptomyces sioyaensis TaxID=67364 RepID=UPI00379B4235